MPVPTLTIVLAAVLATVGLHFVALWVFPRLGLLDFPERYGLKRGRLPYPTGIAAVVAGLLMIAWLWPHDTLSMTVAAAAALLGAVSFLDDRLRLPAGLRLAVQLVIGLALFLAGARIYSFTNPLEGFIGGAVISLDYWGTTIPFVPFPVPVWSLIFTVLWIGLTVNALNWFDGIPGQTTIVSSLAFLTIGLLSQSGRVDQPEIAAMAFALAAVALGCFLFDMPPPRVVIGDSGVMFFGLMLGVLTIYSGGKVATVFLALGVPLTDAVIVGTRRMLQGRSPLRGSQRGEHLHHRLLACGWSPRQIVLLTACIGAAFGGTALFLSTMEKFIAGALLAGLVLALSLWSGSRMHNVA